MSDFKPFYDILDCCQRQTPLGMARLVRIHRRDMAVMPWSELAALIHHEWPGHYALQIVPPADHALDQANKYHVWILERGEGACFDLFTPQEKP